jgi:hypothetical protein
MFLAKITFVTLGIILTYLFYGALKREAAQWDKDGKVSPLGLKLGAFSVLAWFCVTIAGRLTAYLGSLYTSWWRVLFAVSIGSSSDWCAACLHEPTVNRGRLVARDRWGNV